MRIEYDSTNIWKDNWFTKYKKRSEELNDVSLAQFVAFYTVCDDGSYPKIKVPRIIRYCNYDMTQNLMEWHVDSPRQDKIICSMQTLPRSLTDAQSHLGMPNRRNKVTKNGNGPSEGLFA
ncbi:ATP-dependent DNA helicase [Trichonephila clavipes]|nr:ATP-dependent DNA helicase [Trichonephila clavipes]